MATFAVKNDFSEASPSGAQNGLLSGIKRCLVPPGTSRGAWYSGYSLPFGLLYTKFTWMHIFIHSSNYCVKNTSKCTKPGAHQFDGLLTKHVYRCLDRSNFKLWELSIPTAKRREPNKLLLCRRWKPLPTDWNAHFKTLMFLPGGVLPYITCTGICAAQRGRDFEAPDLERGIHFRGVF